MSTQQLLWKQASCGIMVMAALAGAVHAGSLQLLSTIDPAQSAAGGGGDSLAPILSADGRYVLFASSANNLVLNPAGNPIPATLPARLNVYRRDRTNGTTVLVSTDPAGLRGGDSDSFPTGVSADGRFALFESDASNLVAGDTNLNTDIFVRDLVSNVTMLVSVNTNGRPANGVSRSSVITPDGRFVAFVSEASDLVSGDTNRIADVFVRDLLVGTTTLVSAGARATNSNILSGGSEAPVITPDGRYVAFRSTATNLVSGVRSVEEVYLRDLATEATVWVSRGARAAVQAAMGKSNAASFNHQVSDDGQWVAYEAAPAGASAGVVLRYEVLTDTTTVVNTNANVGYSAYEDLSSLVMTPDGHHLAFVANTNGSNGLTTCILAWDAQSGTSSLVSGDLNGLVPTSSSCDYPSLDASGRWVVFQSDAAGLVTNTTGTHLYARDRLVGRTLLLDADMTGLAPSDGGAAAGSTPCLSADGRWVAFEYPDANLAPADRNHNYDVFVRDLTAGTTELVSVHDPALGSLTGNGNSTLYPYALSADGRYLAFASEADNLVANDTNENRDVFLRDLVYQTNVLVSVGAGGGSANGLSFEPSLSTDGRYVVFTSSADNLVGGDTNKSQDVFVRDMMLGTTALVSARTNGPVPGNGASYSPVVSSNGRYVLFRSRATNLAPGAFSTGSENAFLRDLQAGVTYALTKIGCSSAGMTPDGRWVAFIESSGGTSPGKVMLWDAVLGRRVYTNSTTSAVQGIPSPDGTRLAISTGTAPYTLSVVDRMAGTTWAVASDSSAGVSYSGVRWSADSQVLVYAAKVSRTNQVYLYDLGTSTKRLLSHSYGTVNPAAGASDSPDISADGRFIAYRSAAGDIVLGDTNGANDVFLYDRVNDTTVLLSASLYGSVSANSFSRLPVFSGDGHTLVFESFASDVVAQDFNQGSDICALNLFGSSAVPVLAARIVAGATAAQGLTLRWPLAPGKAYRVQFKAQLSDAVWQDLEGSVITVGTQGYFKDPAWMRGQRFYRIVAY